MFGYGIKFLKDHLFYRVKRKVMGVRDGDIRYVLTVPAIWYEGAKLIMKEAAELVRHRAPLSLSILYLSLSLSLSQNYKFTVDIYIFAVLAHIVLIMTRRQTTRPQWSCTNHKFNIKCQNIAYIFPRT